MVNPLYVRRLVDDEVDYQQGYGHNSALFTIKLHHGGSFTNFPGREYVNGRFTYFDFIDKDMFSVLEINDMVEDLGYDGRRVMFYHFLRPDTNLDYGLEALGSDIDVINMIEYVHEHKEIWVYIEHDKTNLTTYISPKQRKLVLLEIDEEPVVPGVCLRKKPKVQKKLMLEWHEGLGESSQPNEPAICDKSDKSQVSEAVVCDNSQPSEPVNCDKSQPSDPIICDNSQVNDEVVCEVTQCDDDDVYIPKMSANVDEFFDNIQPNETETNHVDVDFDPFVELDTIQEQNKDVDEDRICDEENVKEDDVVVNMTEFCYNGNKDASIDDQGNRSKVPTVEVEDLDNDEFESDYEGDSIEGERRRKIRELEKQEIERRGVGKSYFFVGQTFTSREEAKEAIKVHAIETFRDIVFTRNDKIRLRAECEGIVIDEIGQNSKSEGVEPNEVQLGVGKIKEKKKKTKKAPCADVGVMKEKRKKRKYNIVCGWKMHISPDFKTKTWTVKTLDDRHKCQPTRIIHHCTSDYLSTKLIHQLQSNPNIPTKAVRANLERETELKVPKMKAYRALKKAMDVIRGDYDQQYLDLRSYGEELMRCNPGTTVSIQTQPCDPMAETKVFKRIYICLGPLKEGFKTMGRQLLGLDGAFLKQPAFGQLLTAVGLDSNNGIYPVAYAVVEGEKYNSWSWFLELLGRDLDLDKNSNFTFISDRQKGLLQVVSRRFPNAEHRYCLRHIHENMKTKGFTGKVFKQHLWKCATATTVPHFEKAMLELKDFSKECHLYLSKIPPSCWSRSHSTGRCKSDVLLNNICEVFNRWLVDARDQPIISCLEYIREYLMKRIVGVIDKIANTDGPFTPGGKKMFELVRKEASKLEVLWSGNELYQVNGFNGEQFVVDLERKTCDCRRWEITSMPCKHAVAAIWNVRDFSGNLGVPELWVDTIYSLSHWKRTYAFTIKPINGRSMWKKSAVPTKLLPPIIETQAGRPKKNRRKGIDENESMNKDGKLSRKGKSTTCGICGQYGHNRRGCPTTGGSKKRKAVDGGAKKKTDASSSGSKKKK